MTKNKWIAHLGGVFIYAKEPKKLAEWYTKYLGIEYTYTAEYNAYYVSYYYNEIETGAKHYTAWSILKNEKRPEMNEKVFCVNFRVHDLEKLVQHLKTSGVEVLDFDTFPGEGKFAHIYDLEGNYLELWEAE